MAAHCARGDSLYVDGDLEGAVAAYQSSLQQLLKGPSADSNAKGDCLTGLSSAFLGLEQFEEAVESALRSQEAFSEPCYVALLRQGQAAFHLGEFEAALSAFEAAEVSLSHIEGTEHHESSHSSSRRSRLRDWIKKTAKAAEGAKDSLDILTATNQPDAIVAAVSHGREKVPNKRRSQHSISHYETKRAVKLTIHAPGVEPGELVYRFSENEVDVQIERPDETYRLRFAPVGDIRACRCTCTITPTAVVIRLEKADNKDWGGKLIAERKPLSQVLEEMEQQDKKRQSPEGFGIASSSGATAASLPNPYSRAKNWDKVEKDIDRELEADGPKDEGALNEWFQKIFAGADKDTRRAMNKSMQTSNGLVLSTNWAEVKEKDYEGKDRVVPQGMDLKKWEK